jgi:hypothetical protein
MCKLREEREIMKNFVTGYEYSGANAATLAAAGVDAVVTFKQAVRDMGISGKKLKGIKACASLMRFVKDENEEKGKRPVFYSVFDVNDVIARK